MVHGKKRSCEEDMDKLDDLLLEEDELDKRKKESSTGVAGKRKCDSRKSAEKTGGSSGHKTPSVTNAKATKKQTGYNTSKTSNKDKGQELAGDNVEEHVSNHDAIMAALMDIKSNQNQQSHDLKNLANRVEYLENYDYENEDNEDCQDENQSDQGPDEDQDKTEPPSKKQKVDNDSNNNRFSSLAKRCKVSEVCDTKVDESLATTVTDLFRNGMNEEQYLHLVKDENTPRPENCEGLSVVRTNQLIWNVLPPWAQTSDKKMQSIEKTIVKAAVILTKTINLMTKNDQASDKDEVQDDKQETNEILNNCYDALALMGHANRQVNMTRRDFIRSEVTHDYAHLCSHSEPYTNFLFGDDVSKIAKDIENCTRVGWRLRGRGRGRGRARGRGIPRGGRGGHRGSMGGRGISTYASSYNYASTSSYTPKPQSQSTKNAQMGANMKRKEKN